MNWIVNKIRNNGGSQIAVIFHEKEYSYAQLAEEIEKFYDFIKIQISSGKVVAIVSDYCFESIALFFALHENRNIIVPITTKVEVEIENKIRVANCNYVIYIQEGKLNIAEASRIELEHPLIKTLTIEGSSGLILFSSGSTGTPKAMIHNLDKLIDSYKDKKGKQLVFLIFLMFDHIGGLNTMLNCLSMGVAMVFPSNRDPINVAFLIEKYKVNVLPASPTFLNLMLISEVYQKIDLSSLRMITYGTEPMPDSLLLKLKETFPWVKFLQTFGTSETGIMQASSKSSSSTFIKIDDPNTEFKVVEGELWLRSKTQIIGYLNSSMDRFTDDGWFKTGDLVEVSNDQYIKIIGRGNDIINVGGEKVLPSEIESIILQIPGIKDCIVYGEPNPITGQMVVAKVLFDEQIKPVEAKIRIVHFCKGKLDRYKIPAKVTIMEKSEFTDRFKKKRI